MHMLHLCPADTSFPRALFVIPAPLETSTIVPLWLCSFFFFLSSPPHLYFNAYVLFIHSSQIRSQEIRDICCTHFEDASCCSITCGAKVLFAFSGIGSVWLTGGGRLRVGCLINKIFYVNATKERERWDHWFAFEEDWRGGHEGHIRGDAIIYASEDQALNIYTYKNMY